ncbi:hypothetical protein QBC46DRAFT_342929 [Diplogelasinospora grovesii]|uniref:DUF7907 domain-containing protein n=1 Tax=Diplogelasinospora grovesii TaxID=303347 RepID=A0AAN6N4F6_9PEZI|nr:hypothetical protein QBC46DRAFT_342929 [Diplogelasinospora grovesii]
MRSRCAITDTYMYLIVSKGFRLVVNVTDPSTDFKDTPVNGMKLIGVHVGAGLDAPSVSSTYSPVFFQPNNNTIQMATGSVAPWGIVMSDSPSDPTASPFVYDLGINIGGGTNGFGVPTNPLNAVYPCPAAYAPKTGTFAVCDMGFDAYAHPRLLVRFIEGETKGWYDEPENVPHNCVAVKLLPECARLDLGEAKGQEGEVWDTLCYQNLRNVDWSRMKACY